MKRYQIDRGLRTRGAWRRVLRGAAPMVVAAVFTPTALAQIQTYSFDIESQPLSSALLSFGRQADLSVLAPTALVDGKVAPAVRGQISAAAALERLLEGSGLTYAFVQSNAVRIVARDQAELQPRRSAPEDATGVDDRVIVTGTNIRGIQPVASPVDVYSAEDISRTGAVTTEQFVGKLPQNLGTLSQYAAGSTTAGPNLDAVGAVDLRGLGVGTTLTLLNGHRIALSSSGRSADVSFIPASAIERVEVLTDGASAIYGSDAIGGVINFVLRDDFEGAETRLAYGGVASGGLRQGDASQTFGRSWDGGHGLAAYNFHTASALETSDRDYAAAAGAGVLTPVDTRHTLFTTISQDLSDRLTLDVDLGGGWRKVKNGFSNLVSASPLNHTFARYQSKTEQAFGSVALDYRISDTLSADVGVTYSEIDTDGAVSVVRFNRVPQLTTTGDTSSANSQFDMVAKVGGSLFALPGGDVRFSAGGGVLEERFKGISSQTSVQSAGTLGRRSTYAFGELFFPLITPAQNAPWASRLSLDLAARYTDYQDTSSPDLDRDFGDSIDPKIGLLWAPVEALSLRGTYGTSFRAPSLTQLDPTAGTHFLTDEVVAGVPSVVLSLTGYPLAELGPETAETYTLGFDFEIDQAGFRISGTYYDIDYTDRIGTAPTGGGNPYAAPQLVPDLLYRPPSQAFIEQVLSETPLLLNLTAVDVSNPQAGASTLSARSDVWIFDSRLRNLALSRQDGFDVSLSQDLDTSWGDVRLGANLVHILSYRQQGSRAAPVKAAVDVPGQPASWRGRAFAGLSSGAFDGFINVNYTDSYSNPLASTGNQRIDSWTTVDLSLSYDFRKSSFGAGWGTRLSLSVQNLFDQDPPFLATGAGSNIIHPVGFDPANANPLGRFIVLGLVQTW